MKFDYRRYGYIENTELIGKEQQMFNYLDEKFDNIKVNVDVDEIADKVSEKVGETISTEQSDLDKQFGKISHLIKEAEHNIIAHDHCPLRNPHPPKPHHHCDNLATKADVENAVTQINSYIDNKFTDLNLDVVREMNDE